MRLDRWFKRHFPAFSHGQIQKMMRTGQIRVEGRRVEASDRLESGQAIRVPPLLRRKEGEVKLPKGFGTRPLRRTDKLYSLILYQDDDVIALNKPAGLAVQGGTGLKENLDDTLMALSLDGKTKPKLVHRLDRDTSGVLLVARTDWAATQLAAAFRHRETRKIYWAVTVGVPKPLQGRIDAPLMKCGEKMRAVDDPSEEGAKTAVTLYKVLENVPGKAAFVALLPVTGRTHQLRAHLAHIGTPILGDRIYGGLTAEDLPLKELGAGLHLHARRIVLPHPRRGLIDVTAPLGPSLRKTWRWFQFDEKDADDFTGAEVS